MLFKSDKPIKVWFLGNITKDKKILNKESKENPITSIGGAVVFGSSALNSFFLNSHSTIISVGIPSDIRRLNFASLVNCSPLITKLTEFILDYSKSQRQSKLVYFPDEIINIPQETINSEPDLILIVPIYHEISTELVLKLRENYQNAFLACDPQGFIRIRTKSNSIIHRKWIPSDSFLKSINCLKFSTEDLENYSKADLEDLINRIIGNNIIMAITGGKKGSIVIDPLSSEWKIGQNIIYGPIISVESVTDTTGAGDVWIATFSSAYYITKDTFRSLSISTSICSLLIQEEGFFFEKTDYKSLNLMIANHMQEIKTVTLKQGLNMIF